jgi:predicted metalloendopeptidase
MVENIKRAFAERIKALDWMSDSTKQRRCKNSTSINVIDWLSGGMEGLSGLVIEKGPEKASYFTNAVNAGEVPGTTRY